MAKKTRKGRGRPSSIDQLPEDVKIKINAALRDRALTQKRILEAINPVLDKRGEKPISKSALGRYAMAVEEKGAMMREAREAANALVGGLGEQSGTDLGRAVTEMVKTLAFNLVANDGDVDVDTLNKVALISQRIERASKVSLEREEQLKSKILQKAADEVEETAKQQGMDSSQAQFWREKVLGVR